MHPKPGTAVVRYIEDIRNVNSDSLALIKMNKSAKMAIRK